MITLRHTTRQPLPRLVVQRQERTAITLFVSNAVGDWLVMLLFALVSVQRQVRQAVRYQADCFTVGAYLVVSWVYAPVFWVVGL